MRRAAVVLIEIYTILLTKGTNRVGVAGGVKAPIGDFHFRFHVYLYEQPSRDNGDCTHGIGRGHDHHFTIGGANQRG